MRITFNKFDLGIDLRKGQSVSDANRLLEMKNGFVTTGLAAQKRPGLVKVVDLEPGTKGLFAGLGHLHTFYSQGTVEHSHGLFKANRVVHRDAADRPVSDVPYADVFNGCIYAAVQYDGGYVDHHYLDGSAVSSVLGEGCPRSLGVIKLASKIFAVAGDTVRYCKTGNPRDWSTANDAGFLPTGLNSRGDRSAIALGVYQNNLVVMSKDGAQIWKADPDPAAMALIDMVENVGTSYPRSVATVAGDLYFLSDYGFRSITTLQLTNNLADVDVGSPIDSLVRALTKNPDIAPKAFYFYGTGQYLCAIDRTLFVYSISRTAKIAAWSRYELPEPVDAFAQLGQTLYIRCADQVLSLDPEVYTDNGQVFEFVLQLPYMDLKAPGQMKYLYGLDVVMEGSAVISVGYDVRDSAAFTYPIMVSGNTQPAGLVPMEVSGTEFSLKFRNFDDKPFRLDSVSLYFESLGAV